MARQRWIAVASIAAGVALLAALVALTPWRLLSQRAATVPWPGWVAAMVGMSATYALRAGRLRVEWDGKLAALGLGYRECLRITLLHNAAINVLPMRSGEASYAFLLHRRWGVGLGEAAASLLWLRLQDAMVLGVLGIAILVPAPLAWRVGLALAAIVVAATLLPVLVRGVHVRARRARARAQVSLRARKAWHVVAKIAAAFRAARGGRRAWGYAVANWTLKLGVVGALLAPLAELPYSSAFAGALGGELAAVLPLQAPAGVGTYEAGVALGAQVHPATSHATARAVNLETGDVRRIGETSAAGAGTAPASRPRAANADNRRLVFGAALAVHALMVVVALVTALVFSLIVRPSRAPESSA